MDSQVTQTDLFYLEDRDLARQLVQLGYRGTGEALKRDEFEARKRPAQSALLNSHWNNKELNSIGKDLSYSPFLQELAKREESNSSNSLFVRKN